jgi:DNA-binding NtrC family response regulator
LVFNVGGHDHAVDALQILFEADPGNKFQVRHQRIAPGEFSAAAGKLAALFSKFIPDVAFVVLGAEVRGVVGEVLKLFGTGKLVCPVVAVLETSEPKAAAEALNEGADDFLVPPLRAVDVLPRLWRLIGQAQADDLTIVELKEKLGLQRFVGESLVLMKEIKKIPTFACSDASILIVGETGTGKEICARAIHYLSARARKQFVAVDCGALPVDLLENEFFGHESGAYTGANAPSLGLVRQAEGGTLFLDEIAALPLAAQVKFLRFLQEKEFKPLGSAGAHQANVRIIAAANLDFEEAMRAGRFRPDLYHRINVLTLRLPPLRERGGDINLLANYFVARLAAEFGRPARAFSGAALHRFGLYPWPGNVRELVNVIKRAVLTSPHSCIQEDEVDLPQPAEPMASCFKGLRAQALARFERKYLEDLSEAHRGNLTRMSEAAGKDRRVLRDLLRKHGFAPRSQSPAA